VRGSRAAYVFIAAGKNLLQDAHHVASIIIATPKTNVLRTQQQRHK
jgi:hypothetical protein